MLNPKRARFLPPPPLFTRIMLYFCTFDRWRWYTSPPPHLHLGISMQKSLYNPEYKCIATSFFHNPALCQTWEGDTVCREIFCPRTTAHQTVSRPCECLDNRMICLTRPHDPFYRPRLVERVNRMICPTRPHDSFCQPRPVEATGSKTQS